MNEIFEKLGELSEGIKGIHLRLDKINGSIQRHEQDIVNLKLTKSYLSGAAKVVFILFGMLGTLIVLVLGYLLKKI